MNEDRLIKKKSRAKRDGNMRLLVEATNELGDLYFELGRMDEALEEYSEEIKACRIIGDKLNIAVANRMIGEIHASQGEYESALKHQNLHLDIQFLVQILEFIILLLDRTEGAKEVKNEVEEQRALATLGRTYFCLAESLPENGKERIEALANARKVYSRSISLCEKLKSIPREELMTMRARLLLNLGLVQEAQMEPNEGINLIKSAIEICSKYKLSEDLHRAHLGLGALHERQGNIDLALAHLDLAAKTENLSMKANALLAKSELFLRNGEWKDARKVLVALYPQKSLPQSAREQIEKYLRIAVTLCRGEEHLRSKNHELNNFKFYEDLGDAASAARCYDKALEFYKEMLSRAEQDKSTEGISDALVSLAQTFKDAGRFEEAFAVAERELKICTDPREACRSALFLADLSESAGSRSSEIIKVYELAISKAEISGDPSLEATALKEYLNYLECQKSDSVEGIKRRLDLLLETVPDAEIEKENSDSPDVGADIYLDELSDLEQTAEEINREKPTRTRSTRIGRRGLVIRKNEKGETQLHVACINGSIERVEKLLEEGHPTNVRDHCGWTPLHEAANHGFVEIARLLINAGADVNDPGGPSCGGFTPLHDAAACGHFSVMNLLIEKGADVYAITKEGETTVDALEEWRKRAENFSSEDESEFEYIRDRLYAMGVQRRRENRRADKPGVSRNRNRSILDDEDEDEDEEDKVADVSAGEDYKRTIAVLRNRGVQLPALNKSPASHKDLAPLIDSEQVLLDEWLDDDIGGNTTRKKNNLSDPLSTAKRKSASSTAVGERESKRQRIHEDDGVSEMINICDQEEESCDSIFEVTEATGEPEKIRKRKKQASLLNAGFSKVSVSRTPSPNLTVGQKNDSVQQTQPEDVNLRVFIEEKLFKLRLSVRKEQKISAESIVLEIQRKFQDDTGCTPQFELVGPNGDPILPQDNIDDLIPAENSLTLNSKLKKMDVPPISDRYRKICSTCSVEVEEGTMKSLKMCENTSRFRLRGRETLDTEISPLLKSLEYQIRLQVLDLSGGSFNEVGETLSSCLANLRSLQELNLRCCDIDASCLSKVDKLPPQIRVLDLSYNPLGKEAEIKLQKLLSPLKNLQTLNLANSELENFSQGTTTPALTNLDLSWNPVSEDGLRALLQPHMLSLNISGSIEGDKLVLALISHPRFSLATLESLEISSCNLCDSDLSRILLQTSNLNRLIANGNPKLTRLSALEILQHKPTLSHIDISGCTEITEPPDIEASISSPDICTLTISMASEVEQSWLKLWRGKCWTETLPHHIITFKHY